MLYIPGPASTSDPLTGTGNVRVGSSLHTGSFSSSGILSDGVGGAFAEMKERKVMGVAILLKYSSELVFFLC